jgi:hypothetical protein
MPNEIVPGAEFQALPLEYIVATPLLATVKAQAAATEATLMYIDRLLDPASKRPLMVDLSLDFKDEAGGVRSSNVRAPVLSIVPVPHLRIDSLNVQFKYEISQMVKDTRATGLSLELGAKSGGALSPWVDASFRGTVTSQSAQESTTNRSGSLDISVHASEAPIPEGLARLLTLLSNSISVTPADGQPAPAKP